MRFVFSFLLIIILAGCAVKPVTNANLVAHIHNLPDNWTVKGRIALKTREEKFSANLEWQQQHESYRLRLSKLIGGTLLVMEKKDGIVSLEIDGVNYKDKNAERLLRRATGWTLPIDDFKFWISGYVNPDAPRPMAVKKDETSRLWSFQTQDSWQIEYKNYKVFSGKPLPYNMTIDKDDIQVKLRVNNWDFEQSNDQSG